MTYSVIWKYSASQEVTRIESTADDPAAVRAASARMDYILRRYPHNMGESRGRGYRLWYDDMLGVYYHIDDDKLRVDILYAGPARRR